MFDVRSSPCPALSQQSSAPVTLLGAPRSQRAARLPARDSPCTVCALHSTRQVALSFNQPVTFDTSKVKATAGMFLVRSTRDQAPSLYSRGPPPVHAPCAAVTPCTPVSHATPLTPYRMPSPFDSAASVSVQPAAVLRHVQGHRHVRHVSGALRSCPGPRAHSRTLLLHAASAAAASCPLASLARIWPRIICAPPSTRHRAQAPCPPPTSCSSVAHGRAPRPSPVLAMARAGLQEAAPEDRLHMCS